MKASFVSFRIIITKYVGDCIKWKINKQNFLKKQKSEILKFWNFEIARKKEKKWK